MFLPSVTMRTGMGALKGIIFWSPLCSRLAMHGAPAKDIQQLAGHENLSTTQWYMQLSPAAKDAAISLLDEAARQNSGGILETEIAPKVKPGG